MGGFNLGNAMANHGEVISRSDGQTNRIFELVSGENRAHIEIVSHDETIESELIAQQISDDVRRQAGGSFFRLETGIPTMTNHDAVYVVYQFAKHSQLILIKVFARAINPRQLVVSI